LRKSGASVCENHFPITGVFSWKSAPVLKKITDNDEKKTDLNHFPITGVFS
jgi:hypothetical protein